VAECLEESVGAVEEFETPEGRRTGHPESASDDTPGLERHLLPKAFARAAQEPGRNVMRFNLSARSVELHGQAGSRLSGDIRRSLPHSALRASRGTRFAFLHG
jgi:hypothetical protein